MYKNAENLIKQYESANAAFRKRVDTVRGRDNSYSRPEDIPLTDEEVAAIDAYWGKYKFAYPTIDYKSFQTFKNRWGKFDVHHCPGPIRTEFFDKHFTNKFYQWPFQNKALLPRLYPNVAQPPMVVLRMDGIYYTGKYEPISRNRAIELCLSYAEENQNTSFIVKPNASSGGHGIVLVNADNINMQSIDKAFRAMGESAFVVQQVIEQSSFMMQFNPSSVNTIRMTSLMYKGKVHVLAAFIRFGKAGSFVDNLYSGGHLLGIDMMTGKLSDWALASDFSKVSKTPSGLDLTKEELVVPNFRQVCDTVESLHYQIPYMKLIGWDIALDKNNTPTLIECNFGTGLQPHEATTGPLFGELMDEMCDEYLLDKFYLHFATEDFICREYHDRVEIEEYIGASGEVVVPKTLKDKPVTKIMPNAFKGCTIKDFSAPISVMKNSPTAMKSIQ